MSKRKLQVLAVALLAVAMFWALSTPRKSASDEARYQQWGRPVEAWARLLFVERHVPTSVSKLLHLPAREKKCLDKNEEIGEALLASGYLTNVLIAVPITLSIAVTNAQARRT